MGFFSRLFKSADPTKGWPPASGRSPQVSFDRKALESRAGKVPFGANLDAVQALGRPDEFSTAGEGQYTLTYASWGLTLEFEVGLFVQASFLVDPSSDGASPHAVAATPLGPDRRPLSARTTKHEIIERFGQPSRVQDLEGETILYFTGGPLVSEFQLDDNRLTRWDVYVD